MLNKVLSKVDKFFGFFIAVILVSTMIKLTNYSGNFGKDAIVSMFVSLIAAAFSYFFYKFIFVMFVEIIQPYFSAQNKDLIYARLAFDIFAILILCASLYFSVGIFDNTISQPIYLNIVIHYSPICLAIYLAIREAHNSLIKIEI